MRILITGGAGFLGAALAHRLVQDGHRVQVLDDLSAGDPDRLPQEVIFTRGDVRDVPRLWTLLRDVECVYHLAARVFVAESVLYPREYNAVNVGGTVSVMEAMRDAGVRRVVFSSSGAVYGNQAHQPVHEELEPDPDSPYAVSKLAAEHYVLTIGRLWGIETVILRVFNAYGPGQFTPVYRAPVVPMMMKQALSGGSLVIFGDGAQTRDFVYVDDVVNALETAATAEDVDRAIINVGSGQETSINDLVERISAVTERDVHAIHSQAQDGGVPRLVADLTMAQEKLSFRPRVSLEEGLRHLRDSDPQLQALQKQERISD
ncbi:MAG: epimerase [Anaerolineaceae bacterium 4572_32.1]|nr:MAG: epimerase [Anaerolineaceae bacterium 4572_32.1]